MYVRESWGDETVIMLAQNCRVSMDKNGKLIREFNALEAAGRITGPNPYIEEYNEAVKSYDELKKIMVKRGINPADPKPRQE